MSPGEIFRQARKGRGLTQAQLGQITGYSAAQVSRYERGLSPLTDVRVLAQFCQALGVAAGLVGLTEPAAALHNSHGRMIGMVGDYPRTSAPRVGITWRREDGDDPVRRRTFLMISAASAATTAGVSRPEATDRGTDPQTALVNGLRDAMLGLGVPTLAPDPVRVREQLALTIEDYDACRYTALARRLPRLIRAGQALGPSSVPGEPDVLTQAYLLATRMFIKLDDQALGWMAGDRARQAAEARDDVMAIAETARQLAVLARRSGWTDQALAIALSAADDPRLRQAGTAGAAQRGLLIQSAAYTAAKAGDQTGMRELTDEAAAIAHELGPGRALSDHGGGFSAATVQLHRISAETSTGDPATALAAAGKLPPAMLPTIERRSRYFADVAAAHAQRGRRDECLHALLAAEHQAPEETHARPAVRSLISGMLLSGRTTPELRALAARSGVLA